MVLLKAKSHVVRGGGTQAARRRWRELGSCGEVCQREGVGTHQIGRDGRRVGLRRFLEELAREMSVEGLNGSLEEKVRSS